VEMNETANILNHCTADSLIVLDEIGRGTSTYDGLSIAWAVVEHLHGTKNEGPKTLFATHYHELTKLEASLPRLRNYAVTVKEWNDEIIFVRQVTPGASERSFGIQVARLAGLPDGVVGRAKEILAGLEQGDGPTDSTPENLSDSEIALEETSIPEPPKKRRAPPRLDSSQLELF
jgi:DNA mismatch repair protein MutS